jgi:hypothetical protein
MFDDSRIGDRTFTGSFGLGSGRENESGAELMGLDDGVEVEPPDDPIVLPVIP